MPIWSCAFPLRFTGKNSITLLGQREAQFCFIVCRNSDMVYFHSRKLVWNVESCQNAPYFAPGSETAKGIK